MGTGAISDWRCDGGESPDGHDAPAWSIRANAAVYRRGPTGLRLTTCLWFPPVLLSSSHWTGKCEVFMQSFLCLWVE